MEKSELVKYADLLIKKIGDGAEFIKDQIPPLVNEVLRYELFKDVFIVIFGVVYLFFYVKFVNNQLKKDSFLEDEGRAAILIFGFIFAVLLIILIACSFFEGLQILLAPKMFVFEYLRALAK